LIAAVMKMSRREAVRVLAMAVKFGDAAKPALLDGLASSKAFLRHGSALALALLRSEDATRAVIELLLSEPTELWREIARAIGQIGSAALAPLVRHYEGLREPAAMEDRVAWAMAHIGVRGGKSAIEAIAAERSIVTPIATKALDLVALAASDHISKLPDEAASTSRSWRDLTVNHAFSRQFFEALDQGLPEPTTERDVEDAAPEAGES
jgi:HEAT repeat protein